MLTKIRFQNYRCLRDVTIELDPLTVLVGPNSSGKSTVLRALNPAYKPGPTDVWMHIPQQILEIQISSAEHLFFRRLQDGQLTYKNRIMGFSNAQVLHLDLQRLRSENLSTESRTLDTDGGNLTNVFDTLSRTQQGEVARQFAALVPMFADVNARPTAGGHKHLVFQDAWNKDTLYTSSEVSDGTMLVLAYLVTQYQSPQVDLLAIEEPERGLHPYLLGELISLLRKMSKGEVGPKPVQIVLATHSAELLEYVEPSEVRFLSRSNADGSASVATVPADSKGWREAFEVYEGSLGALWLSGSIGGVPKT